MKLLISVIIAFIANLNVCAVKLPVFWGTRSVINKVADLPKTEEYTDDEGRHYDIGTLHKEFTLFFLSVYIIDEPKFVLCDESEEHYIDLTDDEMEAVLEINDLDYDELCQISAFTRYGGKAIFGIIILLFLYLCIKVEYDSKKQQMSEY